MRETAIIIGAGPAGLTAAQELVERTGIRPIVLEQGDCVGGLSRTVEHRGNRMDIGGHRFFSKSDRVTRRWLELMPVEREPDPERDRLLEPRPGPPSSHMLERRRISRIYYRRRFFDYPVRLSAGTLANLGAPAVALAGASYLKARLAPRRPERSLEDFLINRFGGELYRAFFRDYTEKVWGVPCAEIRPEWGAQRIKGLSIASALAHALRRAAAGRAPGAGQKDVETSLIERFYYPKLGPGQLWEEVARRVRAGGGEIRLRHRVCGLALAGGRVVEVTAVDGATGERRAFAAGQVFSTMAVPDLVAAMGDGAPGDVQRVARGLRFRDFVAVGLLVPRLAIRNTTRVPTRNGLIPDNWIYVQDGAVRLGRLQLFQNWSPYMVRDLDKVWLGLEYFCAAGDDLWSMPDADLLGFAARELARIGIAAAGAAEDGAVVRVEKTYPAYFGSYDELPRVRRFTDSLENLYLIGRNGMHRYNNADHSMLTAMTAVDNLVAGRRDRGNIWDVNTEPEYHEERR